MSSGAPNALELFVLGTGTAFPQADRGPTCQLIRCGDLKVAVDLGSGALQKLCGYGASPLELDAVLISHAHLDHINDLMPLLFALNVPSYDRQVPLQVYASTETWEVVHRVRAAWGDWLDIQPDNVTLHPLDAGDEITLSKGGVQLHVSGHAVSHTASSVGFRVQCGDVVLGLPADSGPCDGLTAICQDADLAIVECSLPDMFAMPSHLTPSAIVALAQASGVRAIAVVHRYPAAMATNALDDIVQALDIPVTAPKDGTRFVFELGDP